MHGQYVQRAMGEKDYASNTVNWRSVPDANFKEPLGSNSGVYIYPSTVTIKDVDLHPLSTLSRLAEILKGCRDSSIRFSSQGGDDAIVSIIFVMVLDGLHYRRTSIARVP